MTDQSPLGDLIARERSGDDLEVTVRFRRATFDALTSDGIEVNGRMQLVSDDDAYAVVIWSTAMPDWPDPVPGNEAARREKGGP